MEVSVVHNSPLLDCVSEIEIENFTNILKINTLLCLIFTIKLKIAGNSVEILSTRVYKNVHGPKFRRFASIREVYQGGTNKIPYPIFFFYNFQASDG